MRITLLLLTLCFITPAYADDETITSFSMPEGAAEANTPETIKLVEFITGGIGKEEMDMFNTQAYLHSLRIKATIKQGHYISDAWIHVENSKGEKLLQAEMDGPLLYAKLKPGKYKVTADWKGETETRNVHIPAKGYREIYFRFTAAATEGGLDQRGVE